MRKQEMAISITFDPNNQGDCEWVYANVPISCGTQVLDATVYDGGAVPAVPAPLAVPEFDANGTPWDERIHRDSKTLTKMGIWSKKRNVPDAEHQMVLQEITPVPSVPSLPVGVQPVPAVPMPSAVPVVPVPPTTTELFVRINDTINTLFQKVDDRFTINSIINYFKPGQTTMSGISKDADAQIKFLNHLERSIDLVNRVDVLNSPDWLKQVVSYFKPGATELFEILQDVDAQVKMLTHLETS